MLDLQGGDKVMLTVLTQTEILELPLLDFTCADSQYLFSSNRVLEYCRIMHHLIQLIRSQVYKKLIHLLNKCKQ